MDGDAHDDDERVRRAQRGDSDAFAELVRAHHARVYRVCAGFLDPEDAEDATQEVFVRVHQNLDRFEGRARFGTWVYQIATRVSLNRLRTKGRRLPAGAGEGHERASRERGPEQRLHDGELRAAFRTALAELPEAQRAVVVLRGVEGLPFEEVSRVLKIPVPTAHSRMARARERLRQTLGAFLPGGEA